VSGVERLSGRQSSIDYDPLYVACVKNTAGDPLSGQAIYLQRCL